MKITTQIINKVLHLKVKEEMSFDRLGLSFSETPGTLSFIESETYAAEINSNKNIIGVFITEALVHHITRSDVHLILSDDPRFDFFSLYNYIAQSVYQSLPNSIHADAIIHPKAWIADHNVVIEAGTIIDANASIYPDVHIGKDCRVAAGAVIGKDGFEYKRTSKGILRVIHDGKVFIDDRVDVGANTCVDKGFAFRETIIGADTKIDNLVHVGHGVQIGNKTFVAACAMLGGSTTIGNNVWICPNVNLNTYIKINDEAYVSLGAVVTKDVEAGQQVTGNFAIPHEKFLSIFKSSLK